MRVDQCAKTEYVGQANGNDRQRPFALHPLEVCEGRPREIVFEDGDGFRYRDEAPDRDYYDAVVQAPSVQTNRFSAVDVSETSVPISDEKDG